MRIETLYDQGKAKFSEDALIMHPPFYGVLDSRSPPYLPENNPALNYGRTPGQLLCDIVVKRVASKNDFSKSVFEKMMLANQDVLHCINTGIELNGQSQYPSASFAVASLTDNCLDYIQAGDCMVAWVTKSGQFGASENKVFEHEKEMRKKLDQLIKHYDGDKTCAWEDFIPFLVERQNERINSQTSAFAYGQLNGHSQSTRLWSHGTLDVKNLAAVIFLTDGSFLLEDSRNPVEFAKKVLFKYFQGGLKLILPNDNEAEATALAISF